MPRKLLVALLLLAPGLLLAQEGQYLTKQILQSPTQSFNIAGTFDFDSGKLRLDRGTCPPAASACNDAAETGVLFTCTDGPPTRYYVCASAALGWENIGIKCANEEEIPSWSVGPPARWSCATLVDIPGFGTINAPSGTDPVAEIQEDTLNLACSGLTCTGDSATDTLALLTSPGLIPTYYVGTFAGQTTYSTACGADPNVASSTCDAGSAIDAAGTVSAGEVKRILLAPGIYSDKAIRFHDRGLGTWILECADRNTTTIRVTWTSGGADPNYGGVVSFQGDGSVAEAGILVIDNCTIHSDRPITTDQPGAAVEAGNPPSDPTAPTSAALWRGLAINRSRLIGLGQGLAAAGTFVNADPNDVPWVWVSADTEFVGGAIAVMLNGGIDYWGPHATYRQDSAWCDPPASATTINGTVASGTSTTVFTLDSAAPAVTGDLRGRGIEMAGGSCTVAGQSRSVTNYTSGRIVTVSRAFTATPDANCTYTVHPRPFADQRTCQDANWCAAMQNTSFGNTASFMWFGSGSAITTSGNAKMRANIDGANVGARLLCSGDSFGKKAVGPIVKQAAIEHFSGKGITGSGSIEYERVQTAGNSNDATWLAYFDESEEQDLAGAVLSFEDKGTNEEAFHVGFADTTQALRVEGMQGRILRPATNPQGLALTAGQFELDVPSSASAANVSFAGYVSSQSPVRIRRSPWTASVPAPPASIVARGRSFLTVADGPLGDPNSWGAVTIASGGANKCRLFPATVQAPVLWRIANFTVGPLSSGTGSICLYTPDCALRVAGFESCSMTNTAGDPNIPQDKTCTEANFANGEFQADRYIQPGQYYLAACANNTSASIMGWADATKKILGVGAAGGIWTPSAWAPTSGTTCPTTCLISNSFNVASQPAIWIY